MRIDPVGRFDGMVKEPRVDRKEPVKGVQNIEDAVKTVQKKLEKFKEILKDEAEFRVDKSTGMVIVKIKDKETGEVVRQIPPEVVVRLAKTIDEFLGMLFDERA